MPVNDKCLVQKYKKSILKKQCLVSWLMLRVILCLYWNDKVQTLSFSKQRDTLLQRAVLNFHTKIIIKTTIRFSISSKFAYQTKNQTIQWPNTFSVCRGRFCSKQITIQLRRQRIKNRSESVMLYITIIQIEYYIDIYFSSCFRRYFTVHVFCKNL